MSSISEVSFLRSTGLDAAGGRGKIQLDLFSEPRPPEEIVGELAAIEGPVDVYSWYEGSLFLPRPGAVFMKEKIFAPLYQLKQDAKLCLYSLRAWNFKANPSVGRTSTRLGEAINRINTAAVECIYSSSFFWYCSQISTNSGLYAFITEELPKKERLFALSEEREKTGVAVSQFFNGKPSLFDCINDLDLSSAYSLMQYVEAYYLIRESVNKGILNGQKRVEIAFVLPNDESKYYVDLPKEIEKMLELDFGRDLMDLKVNISFRFFQYGNSADKRPYIGKESRVTPKEISSYFNYLFARSSSQEESKIPLIIPRDETFNLNGWA